MSDVMLNKISYTKQAVVICFLVTIFYCYEYYLRVAPSIISAELIDSFNISNAGLGLLSACFYYAYTLLQIPVGLLIDKYGPRLVLTLACFLCVIGNYIFTNTDHIHTAQVGRLIIGFGSAFAFVGFLKICTNWLPSKYYAMMVGLCMLIGMVGAMGGEILFAWLVKLMAWKKALALSTWTGVVLAIVLWIVIRNEPKGTAINPQTSKTSSRPLLKELLIVLKNPQIWLVGMIGCFTYLPLSSFAEMWAVPYLEAIGYTRTQSAYASSMVFLGFGLGGPIWGLASNWLSSRRIPLIAGSLVSAVSAALIILQPDMHALYMFSALFCLGFFSSAEILVFAVGNDIAFKNTTATTIAIINIIVMLGGIILQPLIGLILDVISNTSVSQYQTALLILPIGLFISSGLSFILNESYKDKAVVDTNNGFGSLSSQLRVAD